MKRVVSVLLLVLMMICVASAEDDYSYDEKNHVFSICNYSFVIPNDFDSYDFNQVYSDFPMFYPERLDAQTSLMFIINKGQSFTESGLVNSLESMKEYLMQSYDLTTCKSAQIIDFLGTKALFYQFSSKDFKEFFAAFTVDSKNDLMLSILQFTDSTDTSNIKYEKDFQTLLENASINNAEGIKGIDYSKMAENASLLYRTSKPERIDGNYYSTYGQANNFGITIYYDIVIDRDELFALQISGFPDNDNNASFSPLLELIKDIEWGNFSENEYTMFFKTLEDQAIKMENENISDFEDNIFGLYVRMSRVKFDKYILFVEIAAKGYEDEF